MVKSILALPPELLENICSFLDANGLKNFGLSCKTLYGIISNDLIWRNFISRKYDISGDQYPESSARAFYQHILHPHAPLIGLWLMEFKDFGGLLRIFVENGCLIGQEMFSHPSFFQPLVTKRIFKIQPEVDEDDYDDEEQVEQGTQTLTSCAKRPSKSSSAVRVFEPSCLCLLGTDETPSLGCDKSQSMLIFHDPEKDRLAIRCLESKPHQVKMDGAFLQSELSAEAEILWRRGYQRWMANWFACQCSRIGLDPAIPEVAPFTSILPAPGFFVGNYGSHGNEILLLRYRRELVDAEGGSSNGSPTCGKRDILEAFKVTGDPNIPKQKVSLRAFLDKPVLPSREEQLSLDSLKDTPTLPADEYGELRHTFYLPDVVEFDMDSSVVPKLCIGRFQAEIQLAYDGYRNAWFSTSQLVIFDQDLFGAFCFELRSFMLFKRVETKG